MPGRGRGDYQKTSTGRLAREGGGMKIVKESDLVNLFQAFHKLSLWGEYFQAKSQGDNFKAKVIMDLIEGNQSTTHEALVAALKSCCTSICGYSVRKSEDYPNLVEGLYNEIKRIDSIVRAALTAAGETV
jgi:hypothetical protein